MNIKQQISELLDGELSEVDSTSELLHVLAVSPEKCEMFLDQIAFRRQTALAIASSTPPALADAAILAGLAAVDAEFAPAPGAATSTPPSPMLHASRRWFPAATAIMLLLLLGAVAGYVFRGSGSGQSAVRIVRVAGRADITAALRDSLATYRDSIEVLSGLRSEIFRTSGRRYSLPMSATASVGASPALSAGRLPLSEQPRAADVRQISAGDDPGSYGSFRAVDRSHSRELSSVLNTATLTSDVDVRTPASELQLPSNLVSDPMRTPTGPWQIGGRTYFRSSLPRVYGLVDGRTALFDKEFLADMRIGSSDGVLARLRAGVAFGETQFSILMHTNPGGAARDSIIEMSPTTFYARCYMAPEILRAGEVLGALELGGGYSDKVGGFGTFGLNLEYRPLQSLAGQVGASTWVLVSQRGSSLYFSTNLNAYFGITYGF